MKPITVAFPEARESDDLERRCEVARQLGDWCKPRVPDHVIVNGIIPIEVGGICDEDRIILWLDDRRGLPGENPECACYPEYLSYKELCEVPDGEELLTAILDCALRMLEIYHVEETDRRLKAKGAA